MSIFIKNPNLPTSGVTELICSKLDEAILDYFTESGIKIYHTETNTLVDKSISDHCDISALYLGNGKIVVDLNQKQLVDTLRKEEFDVIISSEAVQGNYPEDCILNQVIAGEYHIGKITCCDKAVLDNTNDLICINVRQGYAKCSCLVVDEKSIITDDESIYNNLLKNGFDCLLISKGDILLDGHEYGFIGGASGKISSDEVIFLGDIRMHRDFEKIKSFLETKKMKLIYFNDVPLKDYGGIIPLKETAKNT